MADAVRLRPDRTPEDVRGLGALIVVFLIAAALIAARPWWAPEPGVPGVLVEVRGQVARPGWYPVDPPTLAAAVEAAGGLAAGLPEQPLSEGDAVQVGPHGARVVPAGDPLLVGLPVDVNSHDPEALAAVPGLSPELAMAVVLERETAGPFRTLDELTRVSGIGSGTVDRVRPFLTVGHLEAAPMRRVDLNTASAEALQRLPGIGPALAGRIVAHREAHGPFASVERIEEVRGIGPVLRERLADRITVSP